MKLSLLKHAICPFVSICDGIILFNGCDGNYLHFLMQVVSVGAVKLLQIYCRNHSEIGTNKLLHCIDSINLRAF